MQYMKAGEKRKLLQGSCNSNYATIINTGVRVQKKGNVHALYQERKTQVTDPETKTLLQKKNKGSTQCSLY